MRKQTYFNMEMSSVPSYLALDFAAIAMCGCGAELQRWSVMVRLFPGFSHEAPIRGVGAYVFNLSAEIAWCFCRVRVLVKTVRSRARLARWASILGLVKSATRVVCRRVVLCRARIVTEECTQSPTYPSARRAVQSKSSWTSQLPANFNVSVPATMCPRAPRAQKTCRAQNGMSSAPAHRILR